MPRGKTREEFIAAAVRVHGDKYGYDRVRYVNGTTEVEIFCKKCGRTFEQKPKVHIAGHGCTYCANNKPMGIAEFVRRAREVHGDNYTYEKSVYTTNKAKVTVTCRKHGDWSANAYDFLHGHGCPQCGIDAVKQKRRMTQDEFIARCRERHGDEYDYSYAVYRGKRQKVTIVCRKHGAFEQWPDGHLSGQGCPACKFEKESKMNAKGRDKFIEEALQVHGGFYGYDKVVYVNNKTNVTVTCPIHGDFDVMPQDHIQRMNGCPKCQCSKGETAVRVWLEAHGIKFDWHKVIRTDMAIGRRKKFVADFYIAERNLIIEYNGEQHYRPKKEWGGDEQLAWQQARDQALRDYCGQERIGLLEIPYTDFDRIGEILSREFQTNQQ